MSYTKGFKAFNKTGKNKEGECRGFLFKEGEEYEIEGDLELCSNGFHFCKDLVLTFEYYGSDINNYCFAVVESLGEIKYELPNKHKCATSKIKILRFLEDEEVLDIIDGYYNSGDCNSGNHNSGNYNSGNWNKSNNNNGFFNTDPIKTVKVFNKDCNLSVWKETPKPSFLYFDPEVDESYKQCFIDSFLKTTKEDAELLINLPNFDYEVFEDISGITKEMIESKLKEK